jgi:hypothetical protein
MSGQINGWFMNRELGYEAPKSRLALQPYFARVIAAIDVTAGQDG